MKRTSIYQNNPQKFFQDFSSRNEQAVKRALEVVLPYVKNLCKSYKHLREETTAIADDTIMTCLRLIEEGKFSYQVTGNVMGYIFRVAQNEVRSANNKAKRNDAINMESIDNEDIIFDYQPNWENRDIVANILRQLPKEHRKIFVLRMQGYEYEEMQETGWLDFSNAKCMKVIFNKDKKKLKGLGRFWREDFVYR